MTLPRYPEYRASGVEWLGEVPMHWKVQALGTALAGVVNGATPSTEDNQYWDGNVVWVTPVDISQNSKLTHSQRSISHQGLESCSARIVPAGTIVITSRAPVGNVAIAQVPLATNQGCKSLLINKDITNSGFLYYVINSFSVIFQNIANGSTFQEITTSKLKSVAIVVPPLPEQHAIVTYLDRETARLDDLIEKKRRLLALLKERRTAVITHAVTKGLPADEARAAGLPVDPPMKDSGVEWLGEVPAHWVVSDLGACSSKVGSGKTPLGGAETYETEGVPFLRSQNIHNEGLRLTDVVFINDHVHNAMMSSAVNPGDNLLNITGASIGRSCVAPINLPAANVNQHVCIIRARPDTVVNYYLHFYIISAVFQDYINGVQNGTSRQGLNFQQIRASAIGIPPLPEQRAIVAYLDRETARLDDLAAKVEAAIAALGEYRTALITAAVTGQVDVRGAVEA